MGSLLLSLSLTSSLFASPAAAAGKANASSFATDGDGKHVADAAFDGLLSSGWGEGEPGDGTNSWVEVDLGAATKIESVSVWPGNLKEGAKSFKEFGRPKTVQILVDGQPKGEPVRLQNEMARVDIPVDATGRVIRVQNVEVYEGMVFSDTYVAEVAVNFTEGERAKAVQKVDDWRASKDGVKAQTAFEQQVIDAFDKHKADPDDYDSLTFLMRAAGDGPDYLQKRVTTLVPIGYRAAAIVPDQKAIDAIRKLKDPNGIPGLEMAALRALGKEQKEIKEIIEIFYAYADLLSGGRRNIRPWGETGWEPGALQSFGEPLAIEVNRFGDLYVADTGNNRVARYTQDGVSDKQWGAKADVSNRWFGGKRKWYAAGSVASEEQGGLVNPVDVELIPGKDGDGFAVLDATGRIQVFDDQGNPKIGWQLRVDDVMQSKVGGDGYLAWVESRKQLIAVIGDEAACFNLESEEVKRWKFKDGTPNALEAGPDGKLYAAFEGKIISYNPDGFRYGTVGDPAELGEGFEDMDLTFDDKGHLWVLTDTGWLFDYKKPGKLDWKIQAVTYNLQHPRLAVSQGLVFITDHDAIVKVDAAQAHNDELQGKEDAARKEAINAAGDAPPADDGKGDGKKKGKK